MAVVKVNPSQGGGRQHLKSPWGHTKGQKTRRKHKNSTFIVEDRRKSKRK
jgi:large subunit ribosomal protein L2